MPVISTNTAANSALRYLNINSAQQSSSVSKLASGSRITKASDDAAGLAIATSLRSDVTVLKQASTNAANATAILQTADGTMSNIADLVQRLRSLATQSLSGGVTNTERGYLQSEYTQLLDEITGSAQGTRFNGESLMDGSADWSDGTGIGFQVGTGATDVIRIDIANVTSTGLAINGTGVSTSVNARAALNALNTAVSTLSNARANVGALIRRFEFRGASIDTTIENTEAAKSQIEDVDVAAQQSALASEKVKTEAAIAVLSQANSMPQSLLSLLR